MTEVIIRNKHILSILDSYVEEFYHLKEGYDLTEHYVFSTKKDTERGEEFCSRRYLDYKRDPARYDQHSGYPEAHWAMPVGRLAQSDPDHWLEFRDKVKYGFALEIGAHTSALLNYYPPGGFVGWHTNWNANAYQILFTWSKDGKGYFRYWDNEKQEIVEIQDRPGWQCRWYYFGHKDEPEHHCWHSAYAETDRITLAYKFVNFRKGSIEDDRAVVARDQLIKEIEME